MQYTYLLCFDLCGELSPLLLQPLPLPLLFRALLCRQGRRLPQHVEVAVGPFYFILYLFLYIPHAHRIRKRRRCSYVTQNKQQGATQGGRGKVRLSQYTLYTLPGYSIQCTNTYTPASVGGSIAVNISFEERETWGSLNASEGGVPRGGGSRLVWSSSFCRLRA